MNWSLILIINFYLKTNVMTNFFVVKTLIADND